MQPSLETLFAAEHGPGRPSNGPGHTEFGYTAPGRLSPLYPRNMSLNRVRLEPLEIYGGRRPKSMPDVMPRRRPKTMPFDHRRSRLTSAELDFLAAKFLADRDTKGDLSGTMDSKSDVVGKNNYSSSFTVPENAAERAAKAFSPEELGLLHAEVKKTFAELTRPRSLIEVRKKSSDKRKRAAEALNSLLPHSDEESSDDDDARRGVENPPRPAFPL